MTSGVHIMRMKQNELQAISTITAAVFPIHAEILAPTPNLDTSRIFSIYSFYQTQDNRQKRAI